MRILIINWQCHKNPLSGGAEAHLYEVAKRFVLLGNEVTLFCSNYAGGRSRELCEGIDIIRKGGRNNFNFYVPYFYNKLFKNKFDVVIDDINKIPFFTPLFVKEQLFALVHHYFGSSIFSETNFILGNYVYQTENLIGKIYHSTPLFVVSESTKLESIKRGFKAEKIYLAPNGIDPKPYQQTKFEKTTSPTIGYFGRLKKYKSVQHLISAFKLIKRNIPNAQLVIIGKGDYQSELQEMALESGFALDIIFTGFVSEKEKIEWLNKLWVVVNPSMKEGWGIANVEANACGTPVVVANSPGLRDAVKDNYNGLLYEYGDISGLANKVISLLSDKNLYNKISAGAIEFTDNLSWDNTAKNMLKVMESYLKR